MKHSSLFVVYQIESGLKWTVQNTESGHPERKKLDGHEG